LFVKHISLYTIGQIIPKAAGFFLLPLYTYYLSPEEYGIVQSMQVLASILTVVMTLSIERSIYRLYFDYKLIDEKRTYLGTTTLSIISISTVIVILLFIMRSIVTLLFQSISFFPYFAYIIITVFFTILGIIPKIFFQIEEKPIKFITFSLSEFFLKTTTIIYFIVFLGRGAEGMLMGGLITAILLSPIYIYVISKIIIPKWDFNMFKESIKYGYPMVFGLLSAWILNLSDRVFIEQYYSITDVGIYSVAYKIPELLLVFTAAIGLAYNPMFFKIANDKNKNSKQILSVYNNYIILCIIMFAMIITMFSKEFIMLLGDKYQSAYALVSLIMVGILFSQVGGIFNRAYYQAKNTFPPTLIGITTAIINILLNFILVPKYGSYGAAYSTIISFVFLFGLNYYFSKNYYFIPIIWSEVLPVFILFIISTIFFYSFQFSLFIGLLLKCSLIILVCLFFWYKYKDALLKKPIQT
jgi:O-antigen/teichoic acid export membrane protein